MATLAIRPVRNSRRPLHRYVTAVTVAAMSLLGLASVSAPARADLPDAQCLWAGTPYSSGSTVTAGGFEFFCHANDFQGAHWSHAPAPDRRSTVYSAGVQRNPRGAYSPGALQPGSEYNDYCVGGQLIEGTEDLFEVVNRGGSLLWRSVGSVSQWRFDQNSPRPTSTWRSSSLCIDGSLT